MREIGLGLRAGALLVGVGLAFSVVLPVAAQETASALNPDGTQRAVADSTQSFIESVDPNATQQDIFTDAFLACVAEASIDACTGQALTNAGVAEPGGTTVDETPLNPNDTAADVYVPEAPLDEAPPNTPVG